MTNNWKHKEKISWSSLVTCSNVEPKFDIKCAMTKWDDKVFMCNWACNHGVNGEWWIQIVLINPRSQTFTCVYICTFKNLGFVAML
jgi:hypothetical protein